MKSAVSLPIPDRFCPACPGGKQRYDRYEVLEALLGSLVLSAGLPTVSVSGGSFAEGPPVVFLVRLSAPAKRKVTVRFATADGSARGRIDYTPRVGTITFAAGQRSKRVMVSVNDDDEPEVDETLFLVLSAPRGAKLGTRRATATIRASDLPAAFTLRADLSGADEVPEVAHPTGRGTAVVVCNPAREEVSFTVSVQGMNAGPSGIAHGPPRQNALTVLVFGQQFPAGGTLTGTTRLELQTMLDMFRNPGSYLVRVASADAFTFIRGHLSAAGY
jgi:hypothetical protein